MTTNDKGRTAGDDATPKTDHGNDFSAFGRPVDAPSLTSDNHRVGGGYSVQFYTRKGKPGLNAQWLPDVPSDRDMRRGKVDMVKYRRARDLFIRELARHLGGSVLCLEIDGDKLRGTGFDGGQQ